MAENMAVGLKQERQKKQTQLSYMYVLPLLRKFQFKTPLTIETPYLLFGISSIPPLGGWSGVGAQILWNRTLYNSKKILWVIFNCWTLTIVRFCR